MCFTASCSSQLDKQKKSDELVLSNQRQLNWLFNGLFKVNKEIIKGPQHCLSVQWWLVDSPHKGSEMWKLLEISGALCKEDNGLHRGIKCKKISLSWPFGNSQMSSRLSSVIIYDLLLIAYNLMMLDLGNYIQVPEKTEYTYDWGSLSWVIFLQSIQIANINFENVVKPSSNFLI